MAKKQKDETLPGIPFEYDFYIVYWEDIQSDSGWRTLKDIQKSTREKKKYQAIPLINFETKKKNLF